MKKILTMILVLTLVMATLAGCGGESKETDKEIVLNYPTFQVGVNTAAPVVAQLIEEFNTEFAGKYKLVIEEIPGDANYVEKIKILLSTNELPPVVYGGGYNLLDMALSKDLVLDLTPYLAKDLEWKGLSNDQIIETNSRDGKIYSVSSERSLIGYFYNKELFAKAGIAAPATTWDELFKQCDQLLAAGITPMSLDTADSAWVSSLWLGAMVGTAGPEGQEFMGKMMPTDYNTPEFIAAVANLQEMLQKYTTRDAVGGKYENAANNFLSGQTAMMANGSWMIGDFSDPTKAPEGFADKVGAAMYPGSFIYDEAVLGYFATKQSTPEAEAAAVEMIKFFTNAHAQQVALEVQGMVPSSDKVEITKEVKEKYPLLAELLDVSSKATIRTNYLQATMYPNLLDISSQELPNLASGKMTPEQFCQALTDGAKKNQ